MHGENLKLKFPGIVKCKNVTLSIFESCSLV